MKCNLVAIFVMFIPCFKEWNGEFFHLHVPAALNSTENLSYLYNVDSFLSDHNEVIQPVPHNIQSVHPHDWAGEAPLPQQAVVGSPVGLGPFPRGGGIVVHVDQTCALVTTLGVQEHVLLGFCLSGQVGFYQVFIKVYRMLALVWFVTISFIVRWTGDFGSILTVFLRYCALF